MYCLKSTTSSSRLLFSVSVRCRPAFWSATLLVIELPTGHHAGNPQKRILLFRVSALRDQPRATQGWLIEVQPGRLFKVYNALGLAVVFLQTSRPNLRHKAPFSSVLVIFCPTMLTFGATAFPPSRSMPLRTIQPTTLVVHGRYRRLLDAFMVCITLLRVYGMIKYFFTIRINLALYQLSASISVDKNHEVVTQLLILP